jgi:RNA polymerase sigma-70 factor (ECF subfamily)
MRDQQGAAPAMARGQGFDEAMRGVQSGDARAYDGLLRGITPFLRQVTRRRGVPPGELDDVVQETLLALHRCRHHYDPARPFLPWLAGIAQHCAQDRRRRRQREERRVTAMQALHQAWGPAMATEDAVAGGLLAATLERLILALPEAQREAIQCVALAEMDLREAAELTGRSTGAVKVNLHRARRALRGRVLEGDAALHEAVG